MTLRTIIRAVVLAVSALFATQALSLAHVGLSLKEAALILPSLSPFAAVAGAFAARSMSVLLLLCLPVAVLGLWRRRWFCSRMCPSGTLCEYAGHMNRRAAGKHTAWPALGPWLAVAGLGGAIAGFPFFLWLDPLAIFNGFFASLRLSLSWPEILLACGLPAIVLLSVLRPNLWCYRFCPLGGLQEILWMAKGGFVSRLGHRPPDMTGVQSVGMGRRTFLSLAGVGMVGVLAGTRIRQSQRPPNLLRPPGAMPETGLAGTCERCGNCVRVCPQRIIKPSLAEAGVAGFLSPVVKYGGMLPGSIGPGGYCDEMCAECGKVCPTGAIRRLSLETKQQEIMGLAWIDKTTCIAWQGGYCMVCDEVCHYKAIRLVENKGVNCPEVIEDVCRGCGKCQVYCPLAPDSAIVVHASGCGPIPLTKPVIRG